MMRRSNQSANSTESSRNTRMTAALITTRPMVSAEKSAPPEDASTGGFMTAPPNQPEPVPRSEEHTSELQSRGQLVCRLLLDNKNRTTRSKPTNQSPRSN